MDAHNNLTAFDLTYPVMVNDRYGSFYVSHNANTLQTHLLCAIKAGVYVDMSITDFAGRSYKVAEVLNYRPIGSLIVAIFTMKRRLAKVSLKLQRLEDKTFEQVQSELMKIFLDSTTLNSMPCFDEVVDGISQAQNFEDIKNTLKIME